ncbi:DUF2231 domain-containing protein [Aeromicrobium sp. 179-A 4D2 NHS]|uniref:DUF2231 domain-containing protein n=1 Tax=Aeromicrobium sp. 179-A 4D2 NHS TaxID=3142375 RepID=UPI0039A17BA5
MATRSHRRRSSSPAVRLARSVESASVLDPVVRAINPAAQALIGSEGRRRLLQGDWLGHAVHPLMTDLPIGFWTSATVLDLVGSEQSRPGARKLVGLGVLSAVPTAITGWAEWASVSRPQERRVGVVHAVSNAAAIAAYAASWRARARGEHARGRNLALVGAAVASAGGFLGGHLVSARKVSSRNAEFD